MSPPAAHGRRVVVTRAAHQADELAALVAAAGDIPVMVPLLEVVDVPVEWPEIEEYDWITVTSPNGARCLVDALDGRDVPAGVRLAAVGVATSDALGRAADLVPARQNAHGLVAEFPRGTGRVLAVQAADAAPTLVDGLRAGGWTVDVVVPYRSVARTPSAAERAAVADADVLLLASGSAARSWVAAFGSASPPVVVAIGPQCADVARRAGLHVTTVAADHSVAGLVAAIPDP